MLNYIYKLVKLINIITAVLNLMKIECGIYYLSDCEGNDNKDLIKAVVFEASEKIRTFGYIHNESIINIKEYSFDNLFDVKHQAIQNLYDSKYFVITFGTSVKRK